ncbi:MAG: hypothetical protein Q9221_001528 [Calogaya cf. arnoldii]
MPRRKRKPGQRTPRANSTAKPPLPQCKGSKLHAFVDDDASLEFVRLLSDPGEDGAAHVFEVLIGGKPYALKVFKYYDEEEDHLAMDESKRATLSQPVGGGYIPLHHLDHYLDPFFNECRAYGKLVEKDLNGKVAVYCHGYLILPAQYEEDLEQQFEGLGWNRPFEEYDKPPADRQPLRAIVKELVPEDTDWKPRVAVKILRHLKMIRKLGIYVMDIKPENYKGGLLVDFSVALTEPHFIFDIKPAFQIQGYKNEDLRAFDAMMRDQQVRTTVRAFRNMQTTRKLRSYKG